MVGRAKPREKTFIERSSRLKKVREQTGDLLSTTKDLCRGGAEQHSSEQRKGLYFHPTTSFAEIKDRY